MTKTAASFSADAIIARIRGGHRPSEEEAAQLNRLPHIDELREAVLDSDLPQLFSAIEQGPRDPGGLFCSLLRKFTSRPDVQLRLRNRWETADAFMRAHLLWRILDDPTLEPAWHERLFAFTQAEWDTFRQVSLPFMGTPQNLLSQVLRRIGDPTFPDSKKWAYLCRVLDAEDQDATKALLTLALNLPDPFARKVAQTLLDRFFANRS